jgi:hypothetical protein
MAAIRLAGVEGGFPTLLGVAESPVRLIRFFRRVRLESVRLSAFQTSPAAIAVLFANIVCRTGAGFYRSTFLS